MQSPNFKKQARSDSERERLVCVDCGFVAYENPKVIVGSVIEDRGRILLCRRAIQPSKGLWTIPAGYLELNETLEEGARREALEEAGAMISLKGILDVFSLAAESQVLVFFDAFLTDATFRPGPESEDVRQFHWDAIPWDELAFPSVNRILESWNGKRTGIVGPSSSIEPSTCS